MLKLPAPTGRNMKAKGNALVLDHHHLAPGPEGAKLAVGNAMNQFPEAKQHNASHKDSSGSIAFYSAPLGLTQPLGLANQGVALR